MLNIESNDEWSRILYDKTYIESPLVPILSLLKSRDEEMMSYLPYKQRTSFSVSDILTPTADDCGFRSLPSGLCDAPSSTSRQDLGAGPTTLQNPYSAYPPLTSPYSPQDMAQYGCHSGHGPGGFWPSSNWCMTPEGQEQRLASK